MNYSDTEMLDFLQQQLDLKRYTGRTVFRMSTTGRGYRFGETSWKGSVDDVREALSNAMDDLWEYEND
ncbi:MAG: hypothetical protein KAJ19_23380 [Gammaproteobacteria bacterium]|nr:hypothetical protein [Gammaproteobacteria bacterium]